MSITPISQKRTLKRDLDAFAVKITNFKNDPQLKIVDCYDSQYRPPKNFGTLHIIFNDSYVFFTGLRQGQMVMHIRNAADLTQYQHWQLNYFISRITASSQPIRDNDVTAVDRDLVDFVKQIKEIYGDKDAHLLEHLLNDSDLTKDLKESNFDMVQSDIKLLNDDLEEASYEFSDPNHLHLLQLDDEDQAQITSFGQRAAYQTQLYYLALIKISREAAKSLN